MTADELTSDAITGSFRLIQRRRGHRFSVDDLATAWQAVEAAPHAQNYLDMGCGIGSVLLMVLWKLPGARGFGIEAQGVSIELARRNVSENEIDDRVRLFHGDLRELTRGWSHGECDLITGTPPYLPLGTAIPSPDPQRAACRIELRGGIEDYLLAASRVLSVDGVFVGCADGRHPERVIRGAAAAGLVPVKRVDVVPRVGRSPLFAVWTCAKSARGPFQHSQVVMRDELGERSVASQAMRRTFGLDGA